MSNSLLVKFKLFAPQLWQQTVRHRGKFNYKQPKPRHDIARYLEDITKPIITKFIPDPVEKCVESKKKLTDKLKFTTKNAGEFEQFFTKYALNLIQTHEIMLICHKLDCHGEDLRRNRVAFKKNDTVIWNFNTLIMSLLIENNPKYKNLQPIISTALGRNFYFFFNEQNLQKNLTLIRRIPHFVLVGGLIKDRLYTRDGVHAYARLEDIDALRGQLCATLNQQLASLPNMLALPASSLSSSLSQILKPEEAK